MTQSESVAGRPIRDFLYAVHSGDIPFSYFEEASDGARSHSWFRDLVRGDRWAVRPPTPEAFPGLQKLLRVDEEELMLMIAEEWYRVTTHVEPETLALARRIEQLEGEDYEMVLTFLDKVEKGRSTDL